MRADECIHDPLSRVATMVHSFQTHFKVSTVDIADYLASFFKDDDGAGGGGNGSSAAQFRRIADGTIEHGPSIGASRSSSSSSSQKKGGSDVKVAVQSTMISPFFDLLLSDRTAGTTHSINAHSPYVSPPSLHILYSTN